MGGFDKLKKYVQIGVLLSTLLMPKIYTLGTAEEIILDVGFENDAVEVLCRGGVEVLTVTDEDSYSGSHSLKVTERSSSWHGPALDISQWITQGYEYEVSVWVRLHKGNDGNFRLSAQIGRFGAANYVNIAIIPVSVEDR